MIDRKGLGDLLATLRETGFELVGPKDERGAIQYRPIECVDDLPQGRIDEQSPGHYRLGEDTSHPDSLFRYTVGPASWKSYLHPPRQSLWHATRRDHKYRLSVDEQPVPRQAFVGVRACELAAMDIHSQVFADPATGYSAYEARRENTFILAVNCTRTGRNCFCHSMGCGPSADAGYDLVLTELFGPDGHHFLVQVGSETGDQVLANITARPATEVDLAEARCVMDAAILQLEKTMPAEADNILRDNPEHPHWNNVGTRCLACGNCTMVCPTCFCTRVEDQTSLDGTEAARTLLWDSCFNPEFSYIHGGAIRHSIGARYRQWISHKLAHWHDQFGRSGCTGCGRCITWCPVGIDITEEVRALRAAPPERSPGSGDPEHGRT